MISFDDDGPLSQLGPRLAVVVPDTVFTKMHLVGELDVATAHIVDVFIEQQIATGYLEVRLDVGKLAFCDVLGLRALLRAHRRLTTAGGRLVLLRPAALLVRIAMLCQCSEELGLEAGRETAGVGGDSPSA